MLKVKVVKVKSRITFVETFLMMLILSLTINFSSGSVAVADPVSVVATSGVYSYSPTAENDSYVDVTVAPKEGGVALPHIISLIVPQRATPGPATFILTSFSSNAEGDKGYFVVRVAVYNAIAVPLTFVSGGYEMKLPQSHSSAALYSSKDGSTWQKIPESSEEFLPPDLHSIFFRELDGSLSILSDEIGLFGFRQTQVPIRIDSTELSMKSLSSQTLNVTGGSGNGKIVFATTTSSICSVTSTGLVTGLKAGKCLVTAQKFGSNEFIDALSNALSISVNGAATVNSTVELSAMPASCNYLSYSLTTSEKTVTAEFCPKDVGKTATLSIKIHSSSGKWIDKKITTVLINSRGCAFFQVSNTISSSPNLHIFVNGVLWI